MYRISRKLLGVLLALAMIATSALGSLKPVQTVSAEGTLQTVRPVVVVTGGAIIDGAYSAANVSNERSYTLDELKALDTSDNVYSTINTSETLSVYRGQGADLKTILAESGLTAFDDIEVNVVAPDGYYTRFDPTVTEPRLNPTTNKVARIISGLGADRYFYPNFNELPPSDQDAEVVEPIIAWASGGDRGNAGNQTNPTAYDIPSSTTPIDGGKIRLMVGQLTPDDVSNPAWNGDAATFRVCAGDTLDEAVLTVGNNTYTRAEVLLMDRADCEYTYDTQGGEATDYVRGVPMSVLLGDYDPESTVEFEAADGWAVAASGKTVQELIDNDYMLAYERGTSADDLAGIWDKNKADANTPGLFRLYGGDEDGKPAKLINKITVTSPSGEDYSNSPYKHITNGGQGGSAPYNIDAITGATLTVEGPGVKKSVPVSVRDLEGRNAGIRRSNYTDKREGSNVTRTYEGLDLYYILHNMQSGDNGIVLTDNAKQVLIKNRNRRTIAKFDLQQVEDAHEGDNPIMVAYGTSLTDGTNIRPFVFNGGAGADPELGNEDGCIKLVFDRNEYEDDMNPDYKTFGNMAYIYVTEGDPPGYKHDKDPYQSPEISNYVLTVTGEKIGREVNYTVQQLENMVEYDVEGKPDNNGTGYRDEYSLANSNYWYVNEYEGVQLWKLLMRSGLDASYADDDQTIVGSTATDGYAATDKFTTKQVADPNSFGFYEKNPADPNDGSYEGNENLRPEGGDSSQGDLLRRGYPVLVAYGVNGYPYVEKASQEGYMSGLENDGGPLRIISGKKNYKHANGSNQAKLLDKVLVGDDTYHYSTHKYHSNEVYQNLASDELNIKILNGPEADAPELKNVTYTVGDIEDQIYGNQLTITQLKQAKIKNFYPATKNGMTYSDLFEGIDLNFFLTNIVELPGAKGTITFSNGTQDLSLNLEDVLKAVGSNAATGIDTLTPVLAYGKNGAPMVVTKNAADGYEDKVTLAAGTEYENEVTIKNNGGPLELLFPTMADNADMSEKTITGINSITINLAADEYAHTKKPYSDYADDVLTVSGEGTRLTEAKDFTVSELEGKQTIAYTGDYTILNDKAEVKTKAIYRLYNKKTREHLFTSSKKEYDTLPKYGWTQEGTAWNAPATGTGVYRLYNPKTKDHHYTTNANERKVLTTKYGWVYDNNKKPVFYSGGTVKVYRLYNKSFKVGAHHMTTSLKEYNTLPKYGWKQEGVALYGVGKQTSSLTKARYRGINLYSLLTSTAIGLKSNADKVIVTTTDGEKLEFALSEIRKTYMNTDTGKDGLPVLLAYGSGKYGAEDKDDGKALVPEKTSDGFVSAYNNEGGPIRLVIGQTKDGDVNSAKNLKHVKSIEVTASEIDSWNHSASEVFNQYLSETINLSVVKDDGTELFNKDYTVGEIEANEALIERVAAKVVQEDTWEGIRFWQFVLQETAGIDGVEDPVKIDVTAADGYSKELRSIAGMDALNNGIKDGTNYVPILMGYGVNGAPLAIGDKTYPNGEGYDATIGNNGGPIRLIVHNNQGASLTYLKKIKVTAGEGSTPEVPADFTIKGLKGGDVKMSVDDIKNLKNKSGDNVGQAEATYIRKGVTKEVKGAYLKNILAAQGVEVETTKITLNTPDAFETTDKGASYRDITLKEAVEQKYFVAYQEWDATANEWKDIDDTVKGMEDVHTKVRMYRNYCDAHDEYDSQSDWYDQCDNVTAITLDVPETVEFKEYPTSGGVRSTAMDPDKNLWVGTYGGGLYEKQAGADGYDPIYNTSSDPALKTNFTSAVANDAEGGIWVSQNASYTDPTNNQGVLYLKDGEITQYTVEANPGTIPNNYVQAIKVDTDGKVWFGSFGGVTIYDPAADTWTTYTKAENGFPATSCNTIVLDGQGGAWLGFYPDGSGTAEDPYAGGFCHITADGTVSEVNALGGVGDPMFAQSWVRSIAIDKKGTVWAVAAGTNIDDNVGGKIFKLKNGTGEPAVYTGKDVFPDYLNGSSTTEVRVVAVDSDGALWFGTSADGVLKVDNPKPNDDGTMSVTAQYAKETGSWSADNMNNVYSIDFWNDGTAYVGSSGGIQVLGDEPAAETNKVTYTDGVDEEEVFADQVYDVPVGDPTPDFNGTPFRTGYVFSGWDPQVADTVSADAVYTATWEAASLQVYGDGVTAPVNYTIKSLKNSGIVKQTKTYSFINSAGTAGENTFEGAYVEDLLKNVVGLKDNAEKITFIPSDGYTPLTLTMSDITAEDINGCKPMIAWKSDEKQTAGNLVNIDLKLVIGQKDAEDVNKSSWVKNLGEIRVDVAAPQPDLRVYGDGAENPTDFTIKELKNSGVNKLTKTYSWINSSGTSGENTFEGAYIEDLLKNVIGLKENASTITFISDDARETVLSVADISAEDIGGSKPMLAWKSDESGTMGNINLKLVIGQKSEDDVNKSSWGKNIIKIRVDVE